MIKSRSWQRVPSAPVFAALPQLTWQKTGALPASSSIAALMLYVALNFMADDLPEDFGVPGTVPPKSVRSAATYDALNHATGLSRTSISQGLTRLEALGLVASSGSHQQRAYLIAWPETYWFKLPCQAIVKDGVIRPFQAFTLRTKHELHAMKLYLYLSAARDNKKVFTVSSYETIFRRALIPERDIRRAISLLIGCGLLVNVARDNDYGAMLYGPNRYFLAGCNRLFPGADAQVVAVASGRHETDYAEHL